MVNNISGSTPVQGSDVQGSSADKTAGATAGKSAGITVHRLAAPDADSSVQLSAEARNLTKLEAQIRTAPEFDDAKVNSLRAAIADGSYQVNTERVAEKLLNFEQLLG